MASQDDINTILQQNKAIKVLFMGTPDFAVQALNAVVDAGYTVVSAYSQPPKPAGRGLKLTPSPVHKRAEELGIPVETPKSLRNTQAQEKLASYAPDVIVVVAYGLILPLTVLETPKMGCFNIHASLLPRWRGAAPLQRAIMAGDTETGVTIMHMDQGLDTGAMALTLKTPITDQTTVQTLHDTLSEIGGRLIVQAIDQKREGILPFIPQGEDGVTYAEKIDKAESCIDWSKPAFQVLRHIHGLSPFPGAWFEINGERIKVLSAELIDTLDDNMGQAGQVLDDALMIACGQGAVRLTVIQRAGKKPMPASEILKGWMLPQGTDLSSQATVNQVNG